MYSGPINLDQLVDLQSMWERGDCPFTFLAFPASTVDEHGVPKDADAQEYIAAIQAEAVPVGVWVKTPVEGTAYAAVRQAVSVHQVQVVPGNEGG